jgi:hypothetical protein
MAKLTIANTENISCLRGPFQTSGELDYEVPRGQPLNFPLEVFISFHQANFKGLIIYCEAYCSVVVKAICYKAESRGIETRRGELIFSSYLILPATLGPGVYPAYNRNEYQKQKTDVSGE